MSEAEQRPTCETCVYWERLDDEIGKCRKLSPRYTSAALGRWCDDTRDDKGMRHDHNCTAWPVTFDCDWCGSHPDFPAWIEHNRRRTDDAKRQAKRVANLEKLAESFTTGMRVVSSAGVRGVVVARRTDDKTKVSVQRDNGTTMEFHPRDLVKIDEYNS